MGQLMLQHVEQRFQAPRLSDIEGTVRLELARVGVREGAGLSGKRIAVTAGSRGIQNIVLILQTVISVLQEQGASPFIVPAMGSHGGGTADGQLEMLAALGITEQAMGVPILATADAVEVGRHEGIPIYQNRLAYESDGIIAINRVKTHTSFKSKLESGLSKMLVVGLGNPAGAANIHRFGVAGLKNLIEPFARIILERTPVLCGLAIIENAEEQTADIVGVHPAEWIEREADLLSQSKKLLPYLPFAEIDLLIVEEMGKCYSGTGMDTNVIGRLRIHGQEEPAHPKVHRIVALDLADSSHGNANGIGLADIVTKKLVDKIDYQATYLNTMSSTFVQRGMVPMTAPSDERAVGWAIRSLGEIDPAALRIVKIPNTLHLQHLWISEALLAEAESVDRVVLHPANQNLVFDTEM